MHDGCIHHNPRLHQPDVIRLLFLLRRRRYLQARRVLIGIWGKDHVVSFNGEGGVCVRIPDDHHLVLVSGRISSIHQSFEAVGAVYIRCHFFF